MRTVSGIVCAKDNPRQVHFEGDCFALQNGASWQERAHRQRRSCDAGDVSDRI
jgi:hypothetical protein